MSGLTRAGGLAALLLGTALSLTGCGVRPTGVVGAGAAPIATATSLPRAEVFFLRRGTAVPVRRAVAPWDTQAVFDALMAGPTAAERAHGLRTELTPDVPVTIRVVGTKAVFVDAPGVQGISVAGYTQISCTAARLPAPPVVRTADPLLQAKMGMGVSCPDDGRPSAGKPFMGPPSPTGTGPADGGSHEPRPGGVVPAPSFTRLAPEKAASPGR